MYAIEHMKVFQQIEQLQLIHRLIAAGRTGQPDDFARKLGISTRRLHDILDELRSRGVPIRYCRVVKNYFYDDDFQLDISFRMGKTSEIEER